MNKIIAMLDNEDKVLNTTLYKYIEFQYKFCNRFIVCHITEEEYKIMVQQIKNGCLNERLPRTPKDIGYNKFRYMLAYNPQKNNIALANYDDFDSMGSYVIDDDGIHFDEKGCQFPKDYVVSRIVGGTKIYTTISYKEVIEHYSNIKENCNNMPNGTLKNETIEKPCNDICDNKELISKKKILTRNS